jgi:predicted Zn-dependent protease
MPALHQISRDRRVSWQPARAGTAPWRRASAVAVVLLLATPLAACGASSSTDSASTTAKRVCKQVAAVLSDGPEPAADPVGYAQAQVLPLQQIHTSDARLHQAVDGLSSAYAAFAAADGAGQRVKSAVTAAVARVNAICPGAAS